MIEIKTPIIRWQREKIRRDHRRARYRLTALLITDRAADSEDNRNFSAIKLGAIEERFVSLNIRRTRSFHQGLFWSKVDRAFEQLGLSDKQRRELERQIVEKIPRPPDDWALWGVTCIPRFDNDKP